MTDLANVERALLGTMLLTPDAIDETGVLAITDLSLDSNRTILTTIRTMRSKGLAVDPLTLEAELTRLGLIEGIGGAGYLYDLTSESWRGHETGSFIRLLKEEAARREIYAACAVGQASALRGDDPMMIASVLRTSLANAYSRATMARSVPIAELV